MANVKWQDRIKSVANYHASQLKANPTHRIVDTAEELRIANGAVSEAILLSSWMKTDPKIERFEYKHQALNYVRARKHEQRSGE